MAKQKILLDHRWAMGDALMFQGVVRDLRTLYGDRYEIHVSTHYRDLWEGNTDPDGIHRLPPKIGAKVVDVRWWQGRVDAGMLRGKPLHIVGWYHECVAQALKIQLSPLEPKGKYVFLPREKPKFVDGNYWVIVAGGKTDATVKIWPKEHWQKLVYLLRDAGISVVQIGGNRSDAIHFPLDGTINLVGKVEEARDFLRVIRDAQGVICGVTGAMHAAAIMDKPCVVLAGGREDPAFEAYDPQLSGFGDRCSPIKVPHRFLHTVGQLKCCASVGCWKSSVTMIHRKDHGNPDRMCLLPIMSDDRQYTAKCMTLLTPESAAKAVLSYYDGEYPAELAVAPGVARIDVADAKAEERTRTQASRLFAKRNYPKPEPMPIKAGTRKYTVFVLCYGNYTQLATRCVSSILKNVDRSRIDLRVVMNVVCDETRKAILEMKPDVVYATKENTGKYKIMRKILRDPKHPIETDYIIWFDDDTWVVDAAWVEKLDKVIDKNHEEGYRAYGSSLFHDLKGGGIGWFRNAPWWKGVNLRLRGTREYAPNGSCVDFPVGWFWAAHYKSLIAADIPCKRLNHNGGDITIGAQLHQAGFRVYDFNPKKSVVACPTRQNGGRRGYSEQFPWHK